MENKKLRIGVIGCGWINAAAHAPTYKKMKNVEVVALCDVIPQQMDLMIGKDFYPDTVKRFDNYKDLIKMEGLDAIDICTPNKFHCEIAVAALEAGLHVFCEKPDAISVEDAQKMKAASEKNGKVLMVMRNNRYMPVSKFLKKYIEAGKMGEIYAARCGWHRRRGIPGKGGWFTTKEISGGGPLIDLGVHMIDVAIWLMGNPKPIAVVGNTYCKFGDSDISDSIHSNAGGQKKAEGIFNVEDLATAYIRFDNGANLMVEVSWASNIGKEDRYFEFRGTKSGASWHDGVDDKLHIYTEEFGSTVDYDPNVNNSAGMGHHEANLRHFVDVVLNGKEPMFTPDQGIDMIKILEAIYKSAETGKEVLL